MQCVAISADLQTLTPTGPACKTNNNPFRQLAANRCLRGFINMSVKDTISECVSMCLCVLAVCTNLKPLGRFPSA